MDNLVAKVCMCDLPVIFPGGHYRVQVYTINGQCVHRTYSCWQHRCYLLLRSFIEATLHLHRVCDEWRFGQLIMNYLLFDVVPDWRLWVCVSGRTEPHTLQVSGGKVHRMETWGQFLIAVSGIEHFALITGIVLILFMIIVVSRHMRGSGWGSCCNSWIVWELLSPT